MRIPWAHIYIQRPTVSAIRARRAYSCPFPEWPPQWHDEWKWPHNRNRRTDRQYTRRHDTKRRTHTPQRIRQRIKARLRMCVWPPGVDPIQIHAPTENGNFWCYLSIYTCCLCSACCLFEETLFCTVPYPLKSLCKYRKPRNQFRTLLLPLLLLLAMKSRRPK